MIYDTDYDLMALVVQAEPGEVDLDRSGLGRAILEAGVRGVIRCYRDQRSPDGTPWAAWSPAWTAKRRAMRNPGQMKGILTGTLVASLSRGDFQIDRDTCTWTVARDQLDKAKGFNALRPFLGWDAQALADVGQLLRRGG